MKSYAASPRKRTLQTQQLIRYRRGHLTILDREGLEAAACRCYLANRKLYDQILG